MTRTNGKRWPRTLLASVVLGTLGACGGGGGDDPPPAAATTPVSAVGVISGFGSVIVNGVKYDDSAAAVLIQDVAATRDQLRVGMVVELEGRLDTCAAPDTSVCTGHAARIRFRNNLVGPITMVNRLQNTITVMGQTVELDEETVVDGTSVDDISGLQAGDMVAVSGLRVRDQARSHDRIRARLIQRDGSFVNGTSALSVVGEVTDAPDAAGFMVGPVRVRVQASCGLPPAGGVQRGQLVEVDGKAFASGVFDCDRVQVRERLAMPEASSAEIEGYVSDFVSISDFRLDGVPVNAASAVLRNGTAADLANGIRVEAEGVMTAGTLVASRLIFKLDANVQIQAPVQSVDAAGSLAVLGKRVTVTAGTQFVDKTSPPLRTLTFTDLKTGDRLDVRGFSDPQGVLVASRITRTAADPLLVVKAKVDAKTPTSLMTIFGIDTLTGPLTRFRDVDGNLVSAADFYTLVQVPPATPSVLRAQGIAGAAANTVDATRTSSTRGEIEIAR